MASAAPNDVKISLAIFGVSSAFMHSHFEL